MEGDLQPLYLLLTDCYIYLLRKGKNICSGLEVQLVTVTYIDISVCNICVMPITYLLWCSFAGAADKPYNVEDAVSYNELDYLSVSITTWPDYFFQVRP